MDVEEGGVNEEDKADTRITGSVNLGSRRRCFLDRPGGSVEKEFEAELRVGTPTGSAVNRLGAGRSKFSKLSRQHAASSVTSARQRCGMSSTGTRTTLWLR